VRHLNEFRRAGDPRALLAAFGLVNVATIALIAIAPGALSYTDNDWLAPLTVLAVVLYFLNRGSRIAWWIALLLTAPCVVLYGWFAIFGGDGFDAKELSAALLQALAVWVLTAPALEASLGRQRQHEIPA
jgi:lysylphosphatidylglycerol synthetase-like protein (DUF2156 family)